MMPDDKRYRECMDEITATLQKYDIAGAVTIVAKNRSMFKYHFPTWSCIVLDEDHLRFRSKREDYPSAEAQHDAVELSAHIVLQIRDIAAMTFNTMEQIGKKLVERFEIEHEAFKDFDPER
jgi:hypothetical protein